MGRKFTPVWGAAPRPAGSRPVAARPAVAGAATDMESGTEGDSLRQSLRALKVMVDRGLMTQAEYEEHRAAAVERARARDSGG